MVMLLSLVLLFTLKARVLCSFDGPTKDQSAVTQPSGSLQHQGEDCYLSCLRVPGFCDWCGFGNACCIAGDADPPECQGAMKTSSHEELKHYECVKATFLPGQQALSKPSSEPDAAGKVDAHHLSNVKIPIGEGFAGGLPIERPQDSSLLVHEAPRHPKDDSRNAGPLHKNDGGKLPLDHVERTGLDFVGSELEASIDDTIPLNGARAINAGCLFGICEGDNPVTLPSYIVTMGEGDEQPKLAKLEGSASADVATLLPSTPAPKARHGVASAGVLPLASPGHIFRAVVEKKPVQVQSSRAVGALVALAIICLVCAFAFSAASCVLVGQKRRARSADAHSHVNSGLDMQASKGSAENLIGMDIESAQPSM